MAWPGRLKSCARCASASAMPTAFPTPWPSGPVVASTPGVSPCSEWPGERRRSRVSSQQAGLGGLPQADEPVEPAHQHVYLLGARARLGSGLELVADARHFPAPLLPRFGGDLVQDAEDLVARRLVLGHLPQVIGELLALGAKLAEAVHERLVRAARRVGFVHGEFQLYQETGS